MKNRVLNDDQICWFPLQLKICGVQASHRFRKVNTQEEISFCLRHASVLESSQDFQDQYELIGAVKI